LSGQSSNWWVYFNDKSCSQSISLSDKSLEKRFLKNIPLDQYDFPVCQNYVDSLIEIGVTIRNSSRWLNAVSIQIEHDIILSQLSDFSFIKAIRPVCRLVTQQKIELETSSFSFDHFRITSSSPYGLSFNQIDMLGGVDLHNAGFMGEDMVIAVFDAGFNNVETLPIFQNLWDNNQILDTYDFVDNDVDVFGGGNHGTMVLSTMAGYMPDSLIGTAPNAQYMLFRTEDGASETLVEEDNWAAAAEYADSLGVDIINSSLGYTILYDDTLNSHSYSDMDGNSTIITNAADLAASRGILVVNSAGNSGNNSWYYIGAPADGDSVLAVGAVNSLGEITSFSSRGPSYDGRVKPNVCAQGLMTVVADSDSSVTFANGTSFSAPIIAGLSACLWQTNPTMSNMELYNIIEESAHLIDNPNDSLGYGIPNFYQAYLNNLILNNIDNDFKIYPNPYTDVFYIDNYLSQDLNIKVFNMLGGLVYELFAPQRQQKIIFDQLYYLNPGLYFIKINGFDPYPIVKIHEK